MLKTQREKTILKQGLIALAVAAGIYIFFISPFLKEGRTIIDEELDRKISDMKRFITLTGTVKCDEEIIEKSSSLDCKARLRLWNKPTPAKNR